MCTGEDEDDLSFKKGDLVEVLEKGDKVYTVDQIFFLSQLS